MTISYAHRHWTPYGAFELKSSYRQNMVKALFLVAVFYATIAATIAWWSEPVVEKIVGDPIVIDPTQFLPPPLVDKPQQRAVTTPGAIPDFRPPEAEPDNKVVEDIKIPSQAEISAFSPSFDTGTVGVGGFVVVDPSIVKEVNPDTAIFDSWEEAPMVINWAPLHYPEIARKAGVEGDVMVEVVIDKTGNVLAAKVVKESGANAGFEEAAIDAALKTIWRPAMQNKQPVKVRVSYKVKFKLD